MIKKYYPLIIVFFISLLSCYRLFRPGLFSMQDDLHLFRLSEFHQCLIDGQIPCRYSANSALGYGSPVFNFYPPLVYVVGELFHFFGFSLIDSLKAVFILAVFIRSFSFYFFLRLFFKKSPSLLATTLLVFAPYQAVNLYVRGALAEHFALSLIPLLFFLYFKNKNRLLTISLVLLFLTHQLTTLFTIPILLLVSIIRKNLKSTFSAIIWAFLISSFFLIPSVAEKSLTTNFTMTQGYFSYIVHFATLKQLFFDRSWGYGASLWGPIDDMSFQVGYLHWILPLLTIIYLYIKKQKYFKLAFFLFVLSLFFLFLTHNRSTFIWQSLPFMAYFQFPWRFLGPALISLSIIPAFLKIKPLFSTLLIISIILFNISYFKEDIWFSSITDTQKLTGENLVAQTGAGLKDYWPKYSSQFPSSPPAIDSRISSTKQSHRFFGWIETDLPSSFNLPIAYFPKMILTINGQPAAYQIDPTLGTIILDLPPGRHYFHLYFQNTLIRSISNHISLIFLILFILKLRRDQK